MIKIPPKLNLNIFTRANKKPLAHPTFKTATSDGYVMHSDMPVAYKDGTATLTTCCNATGQEYADHEILTQVTDTSGSVLGYYTYSIDPIERKISYGILQTYPDFRSKGVGEIMRLSSLMELKENFIKAIEIDSLENAVPFHAKYKFLPDIKQRSLALGFLDQIAKNPKIKKKYSKKAQELSFEISNGDECNPLTRNEAKKVNKFILKYIKAHKANWQDAKFNDDQYLPMILTKDKIKSFSQFFNKLFKKHGIDYTV
ncbi:MAG: hypothetical protein SPL73_06325 [Cyanobacteriota bacterium]|nr:hypothetical protein [Cyanobacteriota bacterium]MDY6364489.1 hypothetical protein [Cyanobacteriota bacterium]MDY6383224.1 hypothetical protein [Cyanobacteriota bacterium]